jgi:hypothetical protein
VACRDSSTRSSAASCAAGFSPADSRAFTPVRAVSIGSWARLLSERWCRQSCVERSGPGPTTKPPVGRPQWCHNAQRAGACHSLPGCHHGHRER